MKSSFFFLPLQALYALMVCFVALSGYSGSVLSDTWIGLSNNFSRFFVLINL